MDDVKYAVTPANETAIETAAQLLVAADVASRATVIAVAITSLLPDSACVVHRYRPENESAPWTIVGVAGEVSLEEAQHAGNWLFEMPESFPTEGQVHDKRRLSREDYAHLHTTRSVGALAYVPAEYDGKLAGVLEILIFSGSIEAQQLKDLAPIVRLTAPALLSAELFEQQRQTLLDSVHRMSQMYDLEKSLNATLEMDAVIAMVPTKAAAMLPCQAMHLWLFDSANLRLVSSEGADDTVEVGMIESPGEGYVADMAEEGEPLLIADESDERLQARNARRTEERATPPVTNALLVPLMQDEAEIGVLEAINRADRPFDDDDQFLLSSMAETIANALKNASLMTAERKLEILKVLVQVSSEITSTLRLDRLLQIIVNSPQGVLPYELCAIALDVRGRLQLKAVSGMSSMPIGDVQVERLQQLTRWLSSQDEPLHLRRTEEEEGGKALPPEVVKHFDETGSRALYSLPLTDDQGRVGVLFYESSDPNFLGVAQIEMIKVLAGQATVALRNALLYREMPLMGILEPLAQKKAALLRTSRGRRTAYAIALAAAVLFLCVCPLPMRVGGEAVIAPQHLVTVTAPDEGNVDRVYVREGQHVNAGDVLASMTDWEWRSRLAAAEARYQQAMQQMQGDLARGSAQSGADRAQVEFLGSEAAQIRAQVASAQLRSPIAGVVATPNLENAAGEHLASGSAFAQVLDLSSAVGRVAVPQQDIALIRRGQSASIKMDTYPQRTWHEAVSLVSPDAEIANGQRTFAVEVPITNPGEILRAGMSGEGKIFIGWRPAGYVLLRRPALWTWQTLWNWIGW
jgi:RND family efflux transporter MFP subunit